MYLLSWMLNGLKRMITLEVENGMMTLLNFIGIRFIYESTLKFYFWLRLCAFHEIELRD